VYGRDLLSIAELSPDELTRILQTALSLKRDGGGDRLLAGKTLAQAKSALSSAHCSLGRVTKPKPKPGHRPPALVVKSTSPPAGATTTGAVNLTLGPKPNRHHH